MRQSLLIISSQLVSASAFASQIQINCENNILNLKGTLERNENTVTGNMEITSLNNPHAELNGTFPTQGSMKFYPAGSFFRDDTTMIQISGELDGLRLALKVLNQSGTLYNAGLAQPMACSVQESAQ
ncbi:MAG: hypothetical protein BroJett040_00130 [Oligoflexia bacterium]|nr:MAG: hypothetical protein BroJett040_00130 [Oligoflexia bacterium]